MICAFLLAGFCLAGFCAGCGSGWSRLHVENVTYNDLFDYAAQIVRDDGFSLEDADKNSGLISTTWKYGRDTDRGRFPKRRKVVIRIDPDGDGEWLVRVRIDREANWEGYYRITEPEQSEGWEGDGCDDDMAVLFLKKIEILVKDYESAEAGAGDDEKETESRSTVPEVLR